jgi:hypothetical protein
MAGGTRKSDRKRPTRRSRVSAWRAIIYYAI